MKVCVLIMSTNDEPSTSNVAAMVKTFIKDCNDLADRRLLNHEYHFVEYMYRDGKRFKRSFAPQIVTNSTPNYETWLYKGTENVRRTFEKTVLALKDADGYDWYVRINISNFLNIRLLDKVLGAFDKDTVYCNAVNNLLSITHANVLYPRGDMMIFSDNIRKGILEKSEPYIEDEYTVRDVETPHVDDCLIGICLKDYFGASYYEHICPLKYNYLPQADNPPHIKDVVNNYAIGSRVKTVPPGVGYSGYSWEDNQYRRLDGIKMKSLMNIFKHVEYTDTPENILDTIKAPERGPETRPIIGVNYVQTTVGDLKDIIKKRSA